MQLAPVAHEGIVKRWAFKCFAALS